MTRAGAKADIGTSFNIRDERGCSTWPEKNTEERIRRIEEKVSTKAFQQEYMNNPLSEGEVIKEVVWGKCPPLQRMQFLLAYGDPAPSNSRSKASSFKACFLVGYCDGKFFVTTGYLDHVTNDEFVEWYYSLRDYAGRACSSATTSRTTSCKTPSTNRCSCRCSPPKDANGDSSASRPDERCKPPKFDRIEGNLEPLIRQGWLVLNIGERDNPHMKRLEEQFLLLNRQMKSPADGPDCIEGAVWIINQWISTLREGAITIGKSRHASKRY